MSFLVIYREQDGYELFRREEPDEVKDALMQASMPSHATIGCIRVASQQRRNRSPMAKYRQEESMEAQPLDLQGIEDLMRQAMSDAKAKGIAIEPGDFGPIAWISDDGWRLTAKGPICPITATVLYCQPAGGWEVNLNGALSHMLGKPEAWCYAFHRAFDGKPRRKDLPEDAHQLGQQLREEVDAGLWG